ncbi:MAG: alkyl sulfatase dimerization domain-containing protein [Acidimicrobiales bacterium]
MSAHSEAIGAEVLAMAADAIDRGLMNEPDGRPMGLALPGDGLGRSLSLASGVQMIESFAHVHVVEAGESAIVFDTSVPDLGRSVADRINQTVQNRVSHLVLTHGHRDHAGGAVQLRDRLVEFGSTAASVVSHEAVQARFDRYNLSDGYSRHVNHRQFGKRPNWDMSKGWAWDFPDIDIAFTDHFELEVDGLAVELHHVRAETDDHLWAWIPERRVAVTGDLMLWHFPNAGNPSKVQRYPLEWARALRAVAAVRPTLLLPGHGYPIGGEERIAHVLTDTAEMLEDLTYATLELMNAGADLDTVLASVRLDTERLNTPWAAPTYDEPEFVVRNVWRLYGGWYGGRPSELKPAPTTEVSTEFAELAGGAKVLADRAEVLASEGRLRSACHLIDAAADAAPEDRHVHAVRAEIYWHRREWEQSLMAAAIFESAARDSARVAGVELSD